MGFVGLNIPPRRILHQMQHASEHIAVPGGLSDVNDATAGQIADEDVAHPSARIFVDVVQNLIDQEPGRRVNDSPRK